MTETKLTIGFDIDGVVAKFARGYFWVWKWTGFRPDWMSRRQKLLDSRAPEVVARLREQGHTVVFITRRLTPDTITLSWLFRNGFLHDGLHRFGTQEEKLAWAEKNCDLYFDDEIEHSASCSGCWKVKFGGHYGCPNWRYVEKFIRIKIKTRDRLGK